MRRPGSTGRRGRYGEYGERGRGLRRLLAGAAGALLAATCLTAGPAYAEAYESGTAAAYGAYGTYGEGSEAAAAQAATPQAQAPQDRSVWRPTPTGADARFRGLAAVSRRTAWVAGSGGTVLRTADGGRGWRDVSPAGAEGLEFRDIEAFDGRRAVVLAIGEGEASRILVTEDGGASWTEAFRNTDPRAFYDCVTFFDRRHGLAMSDPVDGKYRILSTADGGRSWRVLPDEGMPPALDGEAGFAASGQCLVASGPRDVWLATGGATGRGTGSGTDSGAAARVLHSADRGLTWTAAQSPVPAGDPARGVFGLAFRDRTHGLAVGGDYRAGQDSPRAAATTADGGRTWTGADRPPPAYRSGVAWLPGTRSVALAVGPTGTDLTVDGGRGWHTVDRGSYDTVNCARDGGCWAAGEKGRVARLGLP